MNLPSVFLLSCSLALSFFLSGMEAGFFALNRLRIRRLMRSGNRAAKLLHQHLDQPENFLWTILLGNTLANLLAVVVVVIPLQRAFGNSPVLFWALFLGGVLLFYMLFELLPKMVFRARPNRLCLFLARPFRMVHFLLRPLVWIISELSRSILQRTGSAGLTGDLFGNRDELRLVMQDSATGLTSDEQRMINRVLDLQNLTVRQISIPIAKVVAVGPDAQIKQAIELGRERGFSRIPVIQVQEIKTKVLGFINLNALLYLPAVDENKPAKEFMKPPFYLDHDLRLEDALRQLQRAGQRVGVVRGWGKTEIGLVSLQDILNVVFGNVTV